jgi:phosphoesterase RecJ-like protein
MAEATYEEVAALLVGSTPLCVTTHEAPDGDALGSLLGLGLALRDAGKDVVLFIHGESPLPHEYAFLPLELIQRGEPPPDFGSRALWALDCGSARRIDDAELLVSLAGSVVNVDHHHDNTRFGDVHLVDAFASCTAEIVARLLDEADLPIGLESAEALYVGLITDTGRFQYANTSPAALRLGARLVAQGVQPARIFSAIWETVPFAKQRLLGLALCRARLEADGRLLVTHLERCDFDEIGAADPFSEGVIDHLRAVEGVEVAALIREPREPNGPARKVSLRARAGGVDVSAIARRRGGGGHVGAAGFSTDDSVEDIVAFLRDALVVEPATP